MLVRTAVLLAACSGLVAGLMAGPAMPPVQAVEPDPRPNIVLITTDDQTVDDLRFMPHTRRLIGGEGVRFDDAIATNPLCCPARATILTGQHSHNNGVWTNRGPRGGYRAMRQHDSRTLPVWLQQAGYHTAFIGKYLNGYGHGASRHDVPPGWDSWNAAVRGVYDYYGVAMNRDGSQVSYPGQYQADVYQDLLAEQIDAGAETDQPFFVWQSNLAPHGACWPQPGGGCRWGPAMSARADADRFPNLRLAARRTPSFNERVVRDKPLHIRRLDAWGPGRIERMTRTYRARVRSLQAVDRNVRDTVRLLDERGELDNTLIIFASDNGYLLGEHRKSGKILPYASSLRIPLLMRGPGIPADAVRPQSTALVDIAPTVAAAAGAEPMLTQDGRSLLPLATGASTRGYGAVAIESGAGADPEGRWLYQGVRTPRWTYVIYTRTGERELYNRRHDPHQLNNLAYRPTHRAVRAALHEKYRELRACEGRACRTVPAAVPRSRHSPAPVHPDELGSIGNARQVVTITAGNWSTGAGKLVAWQRSGRTWRMVRGPFTVKLGARGLVAANARRHETGETPVGTFRAASAFGRLRDPGNSLRYRRIDRNDYWAMDPSVPRTYNVFQPRRPPRAVWRPDRYERLWTHRFRFPYALVMDHNLGRRVKYSPPRSEWVAGRPADVRKGSFVIHAGDRLGKHGWVSMGHVRLRWLVGWMRPGRDDTRFVVGTPRHLRSRL